MIPLNKPKIWISLFLFVLILFIIFDIIEMKNIERKYRHYKEVTSETTINSVIIKIEKASRGFSFITFKDNKFHWIDGTKNFNYTPSEIYNYLEVGDSVSKSGNNDTIYIYSGDKVFEFNLRNYIEKR